MSNPKISFYQAFGWATIPIMANRWQTNETDQWVYFDQPIMMPKTVFDPT